MKIFHKKALKDFKAFGWRSYLIIFILVLSIGGSLGFIYVLLAADNWADSYFDSVNHADYIYQLEGDSWINQTELEGLNNLDVVEHYTGRLFWKSSLKLDEHNEMKYILLVGLDPSIELPNVFNYKVQTGLNFNDNENNLSIIIDSDFAIRNSLGVGDLLTLSGLNEGKLNISGFCNTPEFLTLTSNPEYSIPIQGSIGVGYLSKDTLKNYIVKYLEDLNTTSPDDLTPFIYYYQNKDYNNIAITFEDSVNFDYGDNAVRTYLEDTLSIEIETAERFEEMRVYDRFYGSIQDAKKFTTIILIFMLLMGLFITYVIFNRYVYNQKQQIGTLNTFGYKKSDIIKYFLHIFILILVITIPLSLVIGYSVGWVILGVIVSNLANLPMNSLHFIFLPEIIYIGLSLGFFITSISLFIPVISIRKMNVADLVYGQSKSKFSILRIRRSFKPKKRVFHSLIYRNLLRNKKRLLFTTVAMTFSLLIISATQTIIDSMDYNVGRVFKSDSNDTQANEIWDLNVDFQNPINMSLFNNTVDQISGISGINESQVYVKGLITARGEEDQVFLLNGFNAENTKMHFFTWAGDQNSIPINENEIIISRQHSLRLNKKVGDNLTINSSSMDNYTMKIVGIHNELISSGYVSLSGGREILHEGEEMVDGVYILLESDVNKENCINAIYNLKNIEIVLDCEVMAEKLAEFYEDFVPLMLIVVVYGLIVSFFIIFYNSVMNIYDKNYEYGILRSLGFDRRRNFSLILGENMIQGLVAIILALIFTYPLSLPLAAIFQGDGPFKVIIGQNAIIYVIIPPVILVFLGSLISLKSIYKTNLYEQVQTRFIG